MNTNNPYARFDNSLKRFRKSESEADNLVEQFVSVAIRLDNWKTLGFEGRLGDEDLSSSAAERVNLEECPSIEDIYRAKQEWVNARAELKGSLDAMTIEQRSVVIERAPEIRDI